MTREQARQKIVREANRVRATDGIYTGRHLQRCVSIVRAKRLVSADVLISAGFKVHGSRYRPGRAA